MTKNIQVAGQIHCQQCSAALPAKQETQFVVCEFCGATNFVDKTRAVFHYAIQPTAQEETALAALRRWMAGNTTVKNLDQKASIQKLHFEYFPMWMIRTRQGNAERVFWEPGAALSISELKHLTLPAGNLESYNHTLDETAVLPTVPYETMRQWLQDDHNVQTKNIREASLVHVPIYKCKYDFRGRRYTAIVDAATGKVFANIYPARWEAPYAFLGIVAFFVYLFIAVIPAMWYEFNEGKDMAIGLGIYCLVALVAALPIYLAAAIIAKKV